MAAPRVVVKATKKAKKSKKSRKWGRNRVRCAQYRARCIREKNKLRRIRAHLERFPDDLVAVERMRYFRAYVHGGMAE